jgi:predicted O-methyltransferase YrrM
MNWDYIPQTMWISDFISYDIPYIINLLKEYRHEPRPSSSGYYSFTDTLLLHSFIRKNKPINILEIGCGLSTQIMCNALHMNGQQVNVKSYSLGNMFG